MRQPSKAFCALHGACDPKKPSRIGKTSLRKYTYQCGAHNLSKPSLFLPVIPTNHLGANLMSAKGTRALVLHDPTACSAYVPSRSPIAAFQPPSYNIFPRSSLLIFAMSSRALCIHLGRSLSTWTHHWRAPCKDRYRRQMVWPRPVFGKIPPPRLDFSVTLYEPRTIYLSIFHVSLHSKVSTSMVSSKVQVLAICEYTSNCTTARVGSNDLLITEPCVLAVLSFERLEVEAFCQRLLQIMCTVNAWRHKP